LGAGGNQGKQKSLISSISQ